MNYLKKIKRDKLNDGYRFVFLILSLYNVNVFYPLFDIFVFIVPILCHLNNILTCAF